MLLTDQDIGKLLSISHAWLSIESLWLCSFNFESPIILLSIKSLVFGDKDKTF